MSIEKKELFDQIEIVGPFKMVQIRKASIILENGKEISKTFERFIVVPGGDSSNFGPEIKAICNIVHTPEIIESFNNYKAQQEIEAKISNQVEKEV